MQMLYDSDNFVVVHVELADSQKLDNVIGSFKLLAGHENAPMDHAFEIVDKRSNKEVLLNGEWARAFQKQINDWQANTPTQEEVESCLDGYAALAQLPLVVH